MGREVRADNLDDLHVNITTTIDAVKPGQTFAFTIKVPRGHFFVVRATHGDTLGVTSGDLQAKCANQLYSSEQSTGKPVTIKYTVGLQSADSATITVGHTAPNRRRPRRANEVSLATKRLKNMHPYSPAPTPAPKTRLILVQTQCHFDIPINHSALCKHQCHNVTFQADGRCLDVPASPDDCQPPFVEPACRTRSARVLCVPGKGIAQAVFNSTDCSGIPTYDSALPGRANNTHCGGGLVS